MTYKNWIIYAANADDSMNTQQQHPVPLYVGRSSTKGHMKKHDSPLK
jgi:hypothetical protein